MLRRSAVLVVVLLSGWLGLSRAPFVSARAQTPRADTVALVGARVIDGTGRAPIENAMLLLKNGRVEAVSPAVGGRIPKEALSVDVSGKTIIPGLISAHAHVNAFKDSTLSAREQLVAQLQLYASYGITTIQSLGDDGAESVGLRDEQEQGALDRARLYVAGPYATGQPPSRREKMSIGTWR